MSRGKYMGSRDYLHFRGTSMAKDMPKQTKGSEKERNSDTLMKRTAAKLAETCVTTANEPSLALFRVQEHVRKSTPQLLEMKTTMAESNGKIKSANFDSDYYLRSLDLIAKSEQPFNNIQDMLKSALHHKQMIDWGENKPKTSRTKNK